MKSYASLHKALVTEIRTAIRDTERCFSKTDWNAKEKQKSKTVIHHYKKQYFWSPNN